MSTNLPGPCCIVCLVYLALGARETLMSGMAIFKFVWIFFIDWLNWSICYFMFCLYVCYPCSHNGVLTERIFSSTIWTEFSMVIMIFFNTFYDSFFSYMIYVPKLTWFRSIKLTFNHIFARDPVGLQTSLFVIAVSINYTLWADEFKYTFLYVYNNYLCWSIHIFSDSF